jgi:hypothetical protein
VLVAGRDRPPAPLLPACIADPHLVEAVDVDVLDQLVLEELLQLPCAVDRREQRVAEPRVVVRTRQFVPGRQLFLHVPRHDRTDDAVRVLLLVGRRQLWLAVFRAAAPVV